MTRCKAIKEARGKGRGELEAGLKEAELDRGAVDSDSSNITKLCEVSE